MNNLHRHVATDSYKEGLTRVNQQWAQP